MRKKKKTLPHLTFPSSISCTGDKSDSRMSLPTPGPGFTRKKQSILSRLSVPDSEYTDLSPKGSVDEGIRELIGEINALDGFVTTSSCAGRVSIFVEGAKKGGSGGEAKDGEGEEDKCDGVEPEDLGQRGTKVTRAAVGGKGGGGTWLFVSHDPVPVEEEEEGVCRKSVAEKFGFGNGGEGPKERVPEISAWKGKGKGNGNGRRLIHFKFEPMILHILTSSPQHAQLVLRCGLQAGFRESGAHGLVPPISTAPSSASPQQEAGTTTATPMVAIRTMGLGFESLIGYHDSSLERNHLIAGPEYMDLLIDVANERFVENRKRIARFREALKAEVRMVARGGEGEGDDEGGAWEDAQTRRERKRAEGLRRAEEMRRRKAQREAGGNGEYGLAGMLDA